MILHALRRAAARSRQSQHASTRHHLPAASLLLVSIAGYLEIVQDGEQRDGGSDDAYASNLGNGVFGGIGNSSSRSGNRYWAFQRNANALCQQQQQRQQANEKDEIDIISSSNSSNGHPLSQSQPQRPIESSPFRNFVATSSAYLDLRIQRAVTSKRMAAEKSRRTFFSVYEVKFDEPLGSGAYGDVYLCRERSTGEECALKKIPKEFTDRDEFQREMNTLLHIRANGGHPNICMLRENFDEEDDYMLVFDLVDGGEMFEHLIKHGAYSEADASRLLRQVASALDFIHGIGVVHAGMLFSITYLAFWFTRTTSSHSFSSYAQLFIT